jgi:hypothetical protein
MLVVAPLATLFDEFPAGAGADAAACFSLASASGPPVTCDQQM